MVYRRFAHFSPNLLKLLDRGFENLTSNPLEPIEYKGLIEMAEPRGVYCRLSGILSPLTGFLSPRDSGAIGPQLVDMSRKL
jgi:hypothetical protein